MVAMHDYFEVDLPGEVATPCCEHEPIMSYEEAEAFSCECPCHQDPGFDPTPRPYDFEGPARVIPFPGAEEPDPEPPAACGLCGDGYDVADDVTGVCRVCAGRLPKVGGCGLGVRLVASMTSGESGPVLAHLSECSECRQFFDRLGDVARVADMETSHAGSLAAAA